MNILKKLINKKTTGIPETNNEVKDNTQPTKESKRKTKHRVCIMCLKHFTATRVDALYCSNSCRQRAYLKGGRWNNSEYPAEFFLMRGIQFFITRFIDNEGEPISDSMLETWFIENHFLQSLIFRFIEDSNYFKRFYLNKVEAYLIHLSRHCRKSNSNNFYYTIPSDIKASWLEFLETMKY